MKYILTGSRVYGGSTDVSDLDIVMVLEDALDFKTELIKNDIIIRRTIAQDSYGEGGSFYFDLFGIQINIVIAEDEQAFAAWKYATDEMFCTPPINNRSKRIELFRTFYDKYIIENTDKYHYPVQRCPICENTLNICKCDPDIPF